MDYFSKNLLCSTEDRKTYTSGMAWGWVINEKFLIFGWSTPLEAGPLWTIPLSPHHSCNNNDINEHFQSDYFVLSDEW